MMKIGSRAIGLNHPPLVIAEVGINHEGDLQKALELVDAAATANAEVVKFQTHITEMEMVPTDMTPGEISSERLWDIIKRCELSDDEETQVQEYCEKKGMIFLSTPFSREAADRLEQKGVLAFKIGSGECNNIPLLRHIAEKGRPMILSTGMNDMSSVRRSVSAILDYHVDLALLHCTSMYPTPYEKVRLGAITQLQQEFPELPYWSIRSFNEYLDVFRCCGSWEGVSSRNILLFHGHGQVLIREFPLSLKNWLL